MALRRNDNSIYENPLSTISRMKNLLLNFSNRIRFYCFYSLGIFLLSGSIRGGGVS